MRRLPAHSLTPPCLPPAAGNYDEYFGMATDVDAVVYLMLVRAIVVHAVLYGCMLCCMGACCAMGCTRGVQTVL